eukprot:CAMPEP_0198419694 /NCGR_PEP_ID=MMETSP1452-20131203/391_1 /TAXON_ID=1181717 /ORGANISM="Synchroma pusillum, Strain CCMP3072" /LENGTH=81 /DNA_ID=CAMNT_0044139831 /DNA_START=50 /DNA_END=291 /DNA_ORIENTATION=+
MPRYYCAYCDSTLTHDSEAGRKQHMRGWKHRENFQRYYGQFYMSYVAQRGGVANPGGMMGQSVGGGNNYYSNPPSGYRPPP